MNIIYYANPIINSIITTAVVLLILVVFYLEKIYISKNEENMGKIKLFLLFLFSFFVLIFGIYFILLVWNFDINPYLISFVDSIVLVISESIGKIISSIIILFLSIFLLKLAKLSFKSVGKKPGPLQRRKKTIAKVTVSIIRYLLAIISILLILSIWGINVAPALAGLGILGLVIGLGAQKFINDLISGFFIIFEHHFDVGDKIEVQGFKGEVTSIGLKTTKIMNWKGEVKILSNGEISNLINYSKSDSLAIVEFGIAYHEDMQKTIDLLNLELPKLRLEFPVIIEDPKVVGVINLNSSSVDLRAIAKTLNEEHYAVERAMRKKIKEILDENNIEIPFPQVVIHQNEQKK
jgi:moderate conductance mechanosensitive channel